MSATVLYMSMSLDGFIAGPNEGPGNGLGDGGHRLHEWGADADHKKGVRGSLAGANGQVFDEFMATGAVVAGRGTFELAGGWGGDHHDGVPIFVLSRREPGIDTGQWPLVSYVTDVGTAMTRAKEAAGEKNVLVHGAGTARLALAAGVLDELEIHLIPVLLGQGRRLFDQLGPEHIELERTRVLEGEDGVTHMHTGSGAEMSAITHLFAGIPVSDLAASIDWYTRFFGRPPDSRVGQEILWEIDEHAWLFIEPNAAQAGAGRITLSVVGLDALLERLAAQRIEHEPIDTYSNGVRHVNVPDPDGNTIAFAEPPDAAGASPGSAGTEDSSNSETRTATAGPSGRSRPAARKDRKENPGMPDNEAKAAPATNATTPSGPVTGPAAGPLVVSEANPRYFAVAAGDAADGRAVYLTGSHVNNNFHDGSGPGADCGETPEPNDFRGYLGFLKERGHNFIRLWRWEQFRSQVAGGAFHLCMTPQPWPRTGPGTAKDGKPKFDLSRFDPAYFARLRDYVVAAGNEGIYVSVMFFEGFGLHLSFHPDNVEGHPFYAANNVNGIGISSINDYQVLPLDPRVLALQEVYIREVVDTVQDLPNVLYEVANESSGGGSVDPEFLGMIGLSEPPDWGDSTEWQDWVIELVKQYEAQMGYAKHPVGMTMQYPVPDQSKVNDVLFKSPADWISPGFDDVESPMQSSRWLTDPPANDGAKVIISDTDHYSPMKADALWAWKSFFRGHNPILYDLGIIAGANPTEPSSGSPSFASLEPARHAMGDTLRFAREMDLIAMEPRGDLSSTGYALANPGEEYLVLQPLETHDPFAVSLEAGAYSARWQGVVGRETRDGGKVTVEDRGDTSFTAPFSRASPAVLHLKRIGN